MGCHQVARGDKREAGRDSGRLDQLPMTELYLFREGPFRRPVPPTSTSTLAGLGRWGGISIDVYNHAAPA